jgi:hypothetical protein
MSYKPPINSTEKSVFYAYRSTSIVITTNNTQIPLTNASAGASIIGGEVDFGGARKSYCTGEVRETAGSGLQLGDIKINTNDGELSEGYQVRNNGSGIILCDDACYAISSQRAVSLNVATLFAGRQVASEPNETRIIGVFTA